METHQNKQQLVQILSGILTTLGLLLIVLTVVPVLADDPQTPHSKDAEQAVLNLTAAQQQQLATLERASHTQTSQLYTQIRQIRDKLSDLYKTYNLDMSEIRRMNQNLNHIQGQLLDLRLSEQMHLRKILTAEQFIQLQAAIHRPDFHDDHRRHDHDDEHDDAGRK